MVERHCRRINKALIIFYYFHVTQPPTKDRYSSETSLEQYNCQDGLRQQIPQMVTSPRNGNVPETSDAYLMVVFDDRPNSLCIRGFMFSSQADANQYLDFCKKDKEFGAKFVGIYIQSEHHQAIVYCNDDHKLYFYNTTEEAHENGRKRRGAVFVCTTSYGELTLETSYWTFNDAKTRDRARRGSMVRQTSLGQTIVLETLSCREYRCDMPDIPRHILTLHRTRVDRRRGTV